MKKYEIEINNEVYHVSVKELEADADMDTQTKEKEVSKSEPVAEPDITAEDHPVKAPMAGTILNVNVTAGEAVKQGDVLITLEAMKMENEIVVPIDGTVREIFVQTNDSVESDQTLLIL